jgi:hypothetical protein
LQFQRITFEEGGESSSHSLEQEHALTKADDVVVMSLGSGTVPDEKIEESRHDF